MKISGNVVIVSLAAIVCFSIAAVAGAVYLKRDAAAIVSQIAAAAGPAIIALTAIIKIDNTRAQVNKVEQKVNGQIETTAIVVKELTEKDPNNAVLKDIHDQYKEGVDNG